MNFTQLKLILKQPLPVIISKAKSLLHSKLSHARWSKKYINNDLRISVVNLIIAPKLIDFSLIDSSKIDLKAAEYLSSMFISHRFDLLGSGWVKNSYHSTPVGLEGIKFENPLTDVNIDGNGEWLRNVVHQNHLNHSKKIWKEILSNKINYQPIDWQKDYKVGFRFSAKLPYNKQAQLVTANGIDLKLPWELSRFQHLPQLALFTKILPEKKEELILEFKNQVLDFIMTNPPGMGVNWNCTMDVGIRAANLLLAFDWMLQIDDKKLLNKFFIEQFTNFIYWHGKHIVNNFEHNGGLTSNHYLGNIAGLTFVSSYLSGKKELNNWYLLSLQELQNEMPRQFFNDGSNFEGSTSYHRLSGEMFVYPTLIANAITENRKLELKNHKISKGNKKPYLTISSKSFDFDGKIFSESYYTNFTKMAKFTMCYRKANGNITQIGDNDSGRFFRLTPVGEFLELKKAIETYQNLELSNDYKEADYWDENHINHDSFLAILYGFYNDEKITKYISNYTVEQSFAKLLMKIKPQLINNRITEMDLPLPSLAYTKIKEYNVISNTISLIDFMEVDYFKDFGMIVFRSSRLYLNITFGNNNNSHPSLGHQHNDKLSVEINVDEKDVIIDPGTYIYTPLPEKRNYYRSIKSHNTINVGEEQNPFNLTRRGLFAMDKDIDIEVLLLKPTQVALLAKYGNITHLRKIEIQSDKIIITDSCNKEFIQNFINIPFSNGYGKLLSN